MLAVTAMEIEMREPAPTSSRSTLAVVSVLLGCAACCALPILATLGLAGAGAGFLAWLAGNAVIAGVGVAIVIFAAGVVWRAVARRRAGKAESAASCRVDQSCCNPADKPTGNS